MSDRGPVLAMKSTFGSSSVVFATKGKSAPPPVFASKGKSAPPPVFASKGKSAPPPIFASKGKSGPPSIFASKGKSSFSHFTDDSPETASNLRTFRMLFHDEDIETKPCDFHGFDKHDDVVKKCRLIRKLISDEIRQMEKLIRKGNAAKCVEDSPERSIDEASEPMIIDDSTIINAKREVGGLVEKAVSTPMKSKPAARKSEEENQYPVPPAKRGRGRPPKKKRLVEMEKTEEVVSEKQTGSELEEKKDSPEKFIGFSEESPLRLSCKKKLEQIATELEKQDDFLGFPSAHPLRQNCIFKLETIKAELDSTSFSGFKADDPLKNSVSIKYKQVADELNSLIYAIKKKRALSIQAKVVLKRLPHDKTKPSHHGTDGGVSGDQEAVDVGKIAKNVKVVPSGKKQVKVLHPGSGMKRVKNGPRIKSVRFRGGPGQRLPVSKFQPHEYPWNQEYSDPDDQRNRLQSTAAEQRQLLPATIEAVEKNYEGAMEKMLLGRQRGLPDDCLVKASASCASEHVSEFGFPVIVTKPFPPKPLCFLCGSAGIKQLLFCSVCCEPYHPFCVGDDALLASFVLFLFPSKKLDPDNDPLSEEDSKRLEETFRTWTCPRCMVCKACGRNRREPTKNKEKNSSELNRFVKCSGSCREAYHTGCLGKRYGNGLVEDFEKEGVEKEASTTVETGQQWLCETCAKCRSCGIKLEGFLDKKSNKKRNAYMLCVECFRRRQRGSFCPVCNVCYDDNDYDTRMMECGACKRWIHATCEGVSEEQYQILSALPENIEFVCRLCDKTGNPLWLQVVRMEMITGCESILRIFRKKALTESRKRRALCFDGLEPRTTTVVEEKKAKSEVAGESVPNILQPSEVGNIQVRLDLPDVKKSTNNNAVDQPTVSTRARSKSKENELTTMNVICNGASFPEATSTVRRKTRSSKNSNPSRVEMYETSDGNIVSISDCRISLLDILKFPTQESSKYVQSPLKADQATKKDNPSVMLPEPSIHDVKTEVLKSLEEDMVFARQRVETTPKKLYGPKSPIMTTPRILFTPSKKVGDFIEIMQDQISDTKFFSVMHFRDVFLENFDGYFEDAGTEKRQALLSKFHDALKEAFTWFDEDLINNSDLPKHKPRLAEDKSKAVMLYSSNPFEDSYWEDNAKDERACAFCGSCSDMAPDGPGRLLWAGLGEWIHINCALWSSEVWEEESGALQQVGQALTRSRNLVCSSCGKKGASVSCCHGSCKRAFHFSCAVKANCGMKLDKNVFCDAHADTIHPDELQYEFQVQRKVFVDFEYIRKKERPVSSAEIRVFIGSLRVDVLGHILPISVCPISGDILGNAGDMRVNAPTTALVPNQYECTRFYWSYENPWRKSTYQISAAVPKDTFKDFTQYSFNPSEEFHIVINHSDRDDVVKAKMSQMKSFHEWLDTAPRLIDEYNEEWIPTFPQARNQQESVECNNNNYYDYSNEFRDDGVEVEVEPLTVGSYVRLYERMKDLNELLLQDVQMLSQIESAQHEIKLAKKMPLDSFRAFEERLKFNNNLTDDDMRRKLLRSMLDGAVNDSSSEASFSSSSSPSSSANSAVNSEDEETVTETSTSSSEDPEPKPRLTRHQAGKGKKVTRSVTTTTAATTDRRLRSRDTKKDSCKCSNCQKTFPNKKDLDKHSRSCKPVKAAQKSSAEAARAAPVKSKRGRGRPKKTESSSPQKKIAMEDASIGEASSGKRSDVKSVSSVGDHAEENVCPNCKNSYRTIESLQKHMTSCFPYSSSEEFSDQAEKTESNFETQNSSSGNVVERSDAVVCDKQRSSAGDESFDDSDVQIIEEDDDAVEEVEGISDAARSPISPQIIDLEPVTVVPAERTMETVPMDEIATEEIADTECHAQSTLSESIISSSSMEIQDETVYQESSTVGTTFGGEPYEDAGEMHGIPTPTMLQTPTEESGPSSSPEVSLIPQPMDPDLSAIRLPPDVTVYSTTTGFPLAPQNLPGHSQSSSQEENGPTTYIPTYGNNDTMSAMFGSVDHTQQNTLSAPMSNIAQFPQMNSLSSMPLRETVYGNTQHLQEPSFSITPSQARQEISSINSYQSLQFPHGMIGDQMQQMSNQAMLQGYNIQQQSQLPQYLPMHQQQNHFQQAYPGPELQNSNPLQIPHGHQQNHLPYQLSTNQHLSSMMPHPHPSQLADSLSSMSSSSLPPQNQLISSGMLPQGSQIFGQNQVQLPGNDFNMRFQATHNVPTHNQMQSDLLQPQPQHGTMTGNGMIPSTVHQQLNISSVSHSSEAPGPGPHICPHHSNQSELSSGVPSQLNQQPTLVDSAGVTYILVQQGNTIAAIPAPTGLQSNGSQAVSQVKVDQSAIPHLSNLLPPGLLPVNGTGNQNSSFTAPTANPFDNTQTMLPAPSNYTYPPQPQICIGLPNCTCLKCLQVKSTLVTPPVVAPPAEIHTQFISGGTANLAVRPNSPKPTPMSPSRIPTLKKNALIQPKYCAPVTTSPPKINQNTTTMLCSPSPASQEPVTPSKVPISSPNIAVVRPLENPLQKMSNQIAQIEANFNSSIPVTLASFYQSGLFNPPAGQRANTNNVSNAMPTLHAESGSPGQPMLQTIMEDENSKGSSELACGDVIEKVVEDPRADVKTKSIKVTLKRKEGGDSYSINDIRESGIQSSGAMRSLKIKGRITSGEQAGTSTDVVVVPLIQTIPIVKGQAGQKSPIITYDEKQGLVCTVPVSEENQDSEDFTRKARQTHRAVIIYEVKCNDTVLFRSSDVRAVWAHIFEIVQGTRLEHNLPPLAYPVTNISLPENQRDAAASFNMLGLTHQAVQFLLEQLPGTNSVVEKHRFRFHTPQTDDALAPVNPTGCARTEGFKSRKPFDMFGWLASQNRKAPPNIETPSDWARQDLPLAMRFRNLKEKSENTVIVYYSDIHGRGLFTRRDIQEGDIIIEYAGELIRSILSDRREKYYESKGIGCYFFKIDENVIIDATMKGNAARFINHSCEPNCKSKAVDILGKKHILIFAERKIRAGEELTYDYKFAPEDFDKKIPCTCGTKKCRKYLN